MQNVAEGNSVQNLEPEGCHQLRSSRVTKGISKYGICTS